MKMNKCALMLFVTTLISPCIHKPFNNLSKHVESHRYNTSDNQHINRMETMENHP